MSNWYRKRPVLLPATLGAVACGLLGAGPGTASAGTNGQQINYYSHYAYAQCTTGTNPDGNTSQICTRLHIGDNLDQNGLWVGPVTITWYHPDHTYIASKCNVPKSQDEAFFRCEEPSLSTDSADG